MDELNNNQSNDRAEKRLLILALLATALLALIVGTLAWLRYSRSLQTMTTVHVPALYLGGADGSSTIDIDMGDIDVVTKNEQYYAFSVVSKSKDDSNYILQLAHTTNLLFQYEVYEATGPITGEVTDAHRGNKVSMTGLNQVIDAEKKTGTRYDSYGAYADDKDNSQHIHPCADPQYYQSDKRTFKNTSKIDYYILRVYWNGKIENNKETDMVYLSVGPAAANIGDST